MNKYLLTDCDGCLLDFDDAFNRYAKRVGMPPKPPGVHTRIAYEWTKEEQYEWLRNYTGESEFSSMNIINTSYSGLQWFFRNTYNTVVITNWDYPNRYHNLRDQFGHTISEIHLNGFGNSKKDILKRFPPSIWIEDDPKKAQEGLDCGHQCFLIKSDYNQDKCPKGVTLVNDWYEIIALIENNET